MASAVYPIKLGQTFVPHICPTIIPILILCPFGRLLISMFI